MLIKDDVYLRSAFFWTSVKRVVGVEKKISCKRQRGTLLYIYRESHRISTSGSVTDPNHHSSHYHGAVSMAAAKAASCSAL